MPRSLIWLQLLLGWLPVGALFAVMFQMAHGGPVGDSLAMALQLMLTAALLGLGVYRFTQRVPWPHPLRWRFVARHLRAAFVFAIAWFALNVLIASVIASILHSIDNRQPTFALAIGPGWGLPYVVLGLWLYVMVAGIAYANGAAQRSARIEADAPRGAAARAQRKADRAEEAFDRAMARNFGHAGERPTAEAAAKMAEIEALQKEAAVAERLAAMRAAAAKPSGRKPAKPKAARG
jgi:hypothetical protein